MDPLITPIVIVLGKYALDKGVELGKEVGPQALETAKDLAKLALDRLRGTPQGEVIAGEFEVDPDTYQKPVEKQLAEAAQADPDFAAQLKALLGKYQEEARAYAGGTSYQASVKGSGAVAQGEGAVAAGAGGIAVGGNVEGGIRLSGRPEEEDNDEDR